jgi:hypothetical protein
MYSKTFKMSKKMKSPEKTPPANATLSVDGENAPTIDMAKQAISGMEIETSTAPKLSPPERASVKDGDSAFGAAVWQTDKRVTGIYTTYHPRNSWMFINGIGWKRVATANDSTQETMNMLASHCREKACRIDYAEENGLVTEIYVW